MSFFREPNCLQVRTGSLAATYKTYPPNIELPANEMENIEP